MSSEDVDIVLLESFAYNNRADHDFGLAPARENLRRMISLIKSRMRAELIMYINIAPDYEILLKNAWIFINSSQDVRNIMSAGLLVYGRFPERR